MFYVFALVVAALLGANFLGFISMDILLFFLFLISIALFIYMKRGSVKREGIVIIHRTRKGIGVIDGIARKHPRFWNRLALLGVFVATAAMILGSLMLMEQAFRIYTGATKTPGVGLLLPGPASTPVTLPGLFIIPWWIWVIGVAVVMFPHETAHGIVCRLDKIRIKSVGWLFLLFLPGAFVEPDEKQLQRAKRSTKLKVYAAGSFANFVVGFIILVLLSAWLSFAFTQNGVAFFVLNNTPAYNANMSGNIVEIDGKKIVTHEDIAGLLGEKKPGDVISVKTLSNKDFAPAAKLSPSLSSVFGGGGFVVQGDKEKIYTITLAEHPQQEGKAMLGIANPVPAGSFTGPLWLYLILFWAFLFSVAIGIVNLLPIKPLDGGLLFEELTGALTKNNAFIVKLVTMFMVFLLIFNFIGPAIVGG
ncbi:MAG: site-2 protease family protein [Candidatus Aenigmarchaeota archaeon]|nr:site-2 protease family protein [Candidatus Aenigmarchaeota archaeon]